VREVVNAPNRARLPRNKKKSKENNTQFTEISLYGHTHRQDKINRIQHFWLMQIRMQAFDDLELKKYR
jgi:hypothetical protein